MSSPTHREFTLIRKNPITPNMLRLTLGGQGMASFPNNQESAYVKLIFLSDQKRPLLRTYTVSAQRSNEIDIDFVLHGDGGPASNWAVNAEIGDTILIGGPGPKKLVDTSADWFLIVGDMTALPAISVNIAQLPEDARGYAVIEIISESDKQNFATPEHFTIFWQINPDPGQNSDVLLDQVKQLPWMQGAPYIWSACEFNSMRKLRKYFLQERKVHKNQLYISSYWKYGCNEEQHKVIKREDSEQPI